MQGKKSIEALDSLVINADMIKEMLKSNQAVDETGKIDTTPEQQIPSVTANGEIKTDLDFESEVKRSKALYNLEVK